jgi:hypothetical protein
MAKRTLMRGVVPRLLAKALLPALLTGAWAAVCGPALAYRPFDGTDADVAKPQTMEIELQPAGMLREGAQTTLVAPATVLNIGLTAGWEAVFEGRGLFSLSALDEGDSLSDAGAFLKGVLRPGTLQDKAGPSIATEFGVLLPGINAQSGVGASIAGIISQRWDWGTVHLNAATAFTREQHADLFLSTIIEGPSTWKIRPVAEIFVEEEFGQSRTVSGLVGAIWQIKEDLSFDVGFRHAVTNGQPVNEVRVGMTFGFPLRPLGASHHY